MTARAFLTSTINKSVTLLSPECIVMFIADTKYVDAYDADGNSYILDDLKENTIKALALEFGDDFLDVRRGCLVRRSEIRSISGLKNSSVLTLKSDMRVLVSRRKRSEVNAVIRQHRAALLEQRESDSNPNEVPDCA